MNIDFRFTNLIGAVYRNGNITFTADGNSIISPTGNKITIFDLKTNRSSAVSTDFIFNIKVVALTPQGTHALLINEGGDALYMNLGTHTVLYRHRFNRSVSDAKFSPNGRRVAVCRGGDLQIFSVAGFHTHQFNPFVLEETFHITADKINQIDWSGDSRLLATSSEDKQIRIVAGGNKLKNLYIYALASHKWEVIASYFVENSYNLVSIDRRGLANYWHCLSTAEDMIEGVRIKGSDDSNVVLTTYKKERKKNLMENIITDGIVNVSACCFHISTNILVIAFSNGVFVLYEMPTFTLIHNLRVSELKIHSLCINASGDWLGIACGQGIQGQLVVWEWQSETYVMKQQSHSEIISSVAFSPDGSLIATGGDDGKVKIWSCNSSFCLVTFTEHLSVASAVCWTPDGKVLLSASFDGTVRAHDLQRYRNFRTLICPQQTQLTSLATDSAGELIMSSSGDLYNIYVWSLENGKLLDILSGHTAPVAAIACNGNNLVSASWDKTLRLWNVVEASVAESIELIDEALDVAYSPTGQVIAVLCLDCSISLFDSSSFPLGTIDTRLDVDAARYSNDVIKKETSGKSKHFNCICFSADGELIVAGGQSNYICIYTVSERILVKKIKLTTNRSLDGVKLDVNRRNFSEFGNMELIDDSDSDQEDNFKKRIKLAGTKHSDLAERRSRPEMRVRSISFSPTGRCFAVCSTEGVSIYSLDHRLYFNPFELGVETTPKNIMKAIAAGEHTSSVSMALSLNENGLIEKALLATPISQLNVVVRSLPFTYIEKLLCWLGSECNQKVQRHINFWQLWLKNILFEYGRQLKSNRNSNLANLISIQQHISDYNKLVTTLYDQNKYTLRYLITVRQMRKTQQENITQPE